MSNASASSRPYPINTTGKTFREKLEHIIGVQTLFYVLHFVRVPDTACLVVADPDCDALKIVVDWIDEKMSLCLENKI